jgi:beta-lactam-binding protein with PASTA domain
VICLKKLKYLWIINGLIIFSWLFYLFVIPKVLKDRNIIVPDVKGYSVDEAIKKLEENKLEVLVCYVDGTIDEVLYTFPLKDSTVKYGSNINLYVSRKVTLYYEEFIGLDLDRNIDMINNYCVTNGISYEVEYKLDNDSIPGIIINQNKTKKDKVNKGDIIVFTIARSNLYFTMPNLVGLNIYDALIILDNYGIKANVIYHYAPIDIDVVIFQSIGEGNTIKKGNSYPIDIYVSKGLEIDVIIEYNNFIKVLSILDIKYDIIYIESNEESGECLRFETSNIDNQLHYYIYISK